MEQRDREWRKHYCDESDALPESKRYEIRLHGPSINARQASCIDYRVSSSPQCPLALTAVVIVIIQQQNHRPGNALSVSAPGAFVRA